MQTTNRSKPINDERELFYQAQRGCDAAQLALCENHLGLVVQIAKGIRHCPLPLEDRISEGYFGLRKAIARFDPVRGYRFSTYAHWWIRQTILTAAQKKGYLIRLPNWLNRRISKVQKYVHQADSIEIGILRASRGLGLPVAKCREAIWYATLTSNIQRGDIDQSWCEDLSSTVAGKESECSEERASKLLSALRAAFHALPHAESAVLKLRFGLDSGGERTIAQIANELGVGMSEVKMLLANGMQRMKCELRVSLPASPSHLFEKAIFSRSNLE